MRCWQRPEWAEYFECYRVLMGTQLTLTLPGWGWVLICAGCGAVFVVLYFSVTDMIFGQYASLKPFAWVGEQVSYLDWYMRFLCRRVWQRYRRVWQRYRRAPAAEPAGETPAGGQEGSEGIFGRPDLFIRRRSREAARPADPLGEEKIDPDEAEKELARRREEGE